MTIPHYDADRENRLREKKEAEIFIVSQVDRIVAAIRDLHPDVKDEQTMRVESATGAGCMASTPASVSHLVRDGETLCGLPKWTAGNVDHYFAVDHGITDCIPCLRTLALELMIKAVVNTDSKASMSPEQRVTIEQVSNNCFRIFKDGVIYLDMALREHAEIYRLGLIAQLKEQNNVR